METSVMPSMPLPPIAQEAVLKLLAIGRAGTRRATGTAAMAVAQERPNLRLEMPATPAVPAWPGLSYGVPGESPKRPVRRPPARRRPTPEDADRPLSFAGDN